STRPGRVDGLRVALLVTDGTPVETVDQVGTSLEQGGATVVATGQLGADWWDPARSSFRGELASQMSASIVGTEGLGATDVLEHAIVQAMVPGAQPKAAARPAGSDAGAATSVAEGVSNQEVLLEVLTRAKILTLDHAATDGVDALVIVTGEGPKGAGAALNASAGVWEQYLGATAIVVASEQASAGGAAAATIPDTAGDAIAAGSDTPAPTRPSVVVLSDPKLAAAQIVMALKEQSVGGSGTYGTAAGLDIVAVP
ncbi:MAG: copper transporter, partial [Demequinaceae bacterium]|nr:copper transporter [Demequinaceae bacterium]